MNRKQLVILLVVVGVVGVAGWLRYQQTRTSWQADSKAIGQKLLGDLPVNDVAGIIIKSHTNELNLVRKDNLWRVHERNDYPANYSEISGFLLKAQDLKVAQTEEIGKSMLGRYKLLPPAEGGTNSALLLELRDQNGKALRTLLLGKPHKHKSQGRASPMGDLEDDGYPDGRYVMVGTGAKTVSVISDPLSNIEPTPATWLNKDFFRVEKVRSIAVAFPAATNSWKVSRDSETAEWKLADGKPGEQLDSAKTSGLATALSSPTFNDVDTAAKPQALGLDKPTVVTLDTFDNFTYTLKVGQKTNDIIPLTLTVDAQLPKERTPGKDEKPADKTKLDKEFQDKQKTLQDKLAQEKSYQNWTYLVSGWTLDSVLKDRAQLLVEKKDEKPSAATDASKKDEAAAKTDSTQEKSQ